MKKYILTLLLFSLFGCNNDRPAKNKTQSTNQVPQASQFRPIKQAARKLLGQQVYVPIYSSIYKQYEKNLLHMTATLSIRNTSLKQEIIINKIDYYDTNGKLIKTYIDKPFSLGTMSSQDFTIAENDLVGGTGANFIVEWESPKLVSTPLIESIMIGTFGNKGFSFSSRGKEIEAH